MNAASGMKIIERLVPTLHCGQGLLAVARPPRVDLDAPIHKRGPSIIELIAEHADRSLAHDSAGEARASARELIPLILPEPLASGVALYAQSEEVAERLAKAADAGRIKYAHLVIAKGKPQRDRIRVGAAKSAKGRSSKAAAVPAADTGPTPTALLEVIRSERDLHILRCTTSAAGLNDLRRIVKRAGLAIAGDPRQDVLRHPGAPKPRLRLLMHLEQVTFPNPTGKDQIVITAGLPRSWQGFLATGALTDEHLQVALINRLDCLLDKQTDCLRLFGAHEGISGLAVDKYATVLVVEILEGMYHGDANRLRQVANWYQERLDVRSVYHKTVPRRKSDAHGTGGSTPVALLKGEAVVETTVIENGLRFIVQPAAGLSSGLFCDQRENRRRIQALADGKAVLNLFAYTCGFSVAAAAGGAARTTSVDLSKSSLDWGRRNFDANGLSADQHRFIRSEAFDFCKRAAGRGDAFDLIILDPPSFARSKRPKRVFEIGKHLVDLIECALTILSPGGLILLSTNHRKKVSGWLKSQAADAAARSHRPFKIVAVPKLPVDFAPDPAYQKSILIRFD